MYVYVKINDKFNDKFEIVDHKSIRNFDYKNFNRCKEYFVETLGEPGIILFCEESLTKLQEKIDSSRVRIPPSHLILSASELDVEEEKSNKNKEVIKSTQKILQNKLNKLNLDKVS
ncbi:hypothetical protein TKK_0013708 [Trichogramma kaykai]